MKRFIEGECGERSTLLPEFLTITKVKTIRFVSSMRLLSGLICNSEGLTAFNQQRLVGRPTSQTSQEFLLRLAQPIRYRMQCSDFFNRLIVELSTASGIGVWDEQIALGNAV